MKDQAKTKARCLPRRGRHALADTLVPAEILGIIQP